MRIHDEVDVGDDSVHPSLERRDGVETRVVGRARAAFSRVQADGRWKAAVAVALTTIVLLPVLVVVITRVNRPYLPLQDLATTDMRVRDLWSDQIPLVGPYSRGWSHPGPMMFWLMGLLSGLAGKAAWATLVGGALLQGVAIAASARLAWLRGRLPMLLLVLAALSLAYDSPYMYLVAWNPQVAFPYFALYLLLIWSIAVGEADKVVWATVVGTFLIQTHLGYLFLVIVPAIWVACVVAADARRSRRVSKAWRSAIRWSALTAGLLWLPPVIEQIMNRPGNFTRIAKYFLVNTDARAGFRVGSGLFASEFRFPPPWLGGRESFKVYSVEVLPAALGWLLIPVLLFAIGAFAVRRSGSRADGRLLTLLALVSLTGIVAMAQVPDVERYLFMWRVLLALFVILAVAWSVAHWLRLPQRRPVWILCGVAVIAVVAHQSSVLAVDTARAEVGKVMPFEPVAREVIRQIESRGLPSRPVLMRRFGSAGGLDEAVLDELDRRGAPMRVDDVVGYKFGDRRTASLGEVSSVWYVVIDGQLIGTLARLPGASMVARTTPLSAREETELSRLQLSIDDGLVRAHREDLIRTVGSNLVGFTLKGVAGLDQRDVDQVARLNNKVGRLGGCRCAIIAVPPATARALDKRRR